jgi:hypothetical protein
MVDANLKHAAKNVQLSDGGVHSNGKGQKGKGRKRDRSCDLSRDARGLVGFTGSIATAASVDASRGSAVVSVVVRQGTGGGQHAQPMGNRLPGGHGGADTASNRAAESVPDSDHLYHQRGAARVGAKHTKPGSLTNRKADLAANLARYRKQVDFFCHKRCGAYPSENAFGRNILIAWMRLGASDEDIVTATRWWSSLVDLRGLRRAAWKKINRLIEIGPFLGITRAEKRKWGRAVSVLRPVGSWQQWRSEVKKRAISKQNDKRREARQKAKAKRATIERQNNRGIALLQMIAIRRDWIPVPDLISQATTCIAFRSLERSSLVAVVHRRLNHLVEAKLIETKTSSYPGYKCAARLKRAVRWVRAIPAQDFNLNTLTPKRIGRKRRAHKGLRPKNACKKHGYLNTKSNDVATVSRPKNTIRRKTEQHAPSGIEELRRCTDCGHFHRVGACRHSAGLCSPRECKGPPIGGLLRIVPNIRRRV